MRRRAAVEPVIGHIKAEHRMGRNYLKGRDGDRINAVLAAATTSVCSCAGSSGFYAPSSERCSPPRGAPKPPKDVPQRIFHGRLIFKMTNYRPLLSSLLYGEGAC
jgi:hypothetical protein